MAGLYRRYEAAKTRAGRIDFEDMLELTIGLIEADPAIAAEVRDRYRWFSVDEYQDTNPLQAACSSLARRSRGPRGRGRRGPDDLHLHRRHERLPDRVRGPLSERPGRRPRDELPLDAPGPGVRQSASWPPGGRTRRAEAGDRARPAKRLVAARRRPGPVIGGFASDDAELDGITGRSGTLARAGRRTARCAILVRINAQLPAIEAPSVRPASRSTFAASGSSHDPRSGGRCGSPARWRA